MIRYKAFYKENNYSFWFIVFIWGICLYFLITEPKGYFVLLFDENRTPSLNHIFMMITQLAEGYFCVFACLLLLVINWKKGILLSLTLIVNSLFGQFLKRMVFKDHHRPNYYFNEKLHEIADFQFHNDYSFPSGHTIAGMSLFFIFSLLVKNKMIKLSLLLLGFLIAISRMYLAQHFLEDVLFGSVIAVSLSSIYYLVYTEKVSWE